MNPEFTPAQNSAPTDEQDLLLRREALRRGLRRANIAWVVIVAVIAALTLGVVWKAGQSAREAGRANHHAHQAALEAERANVETDRAEAELWNARFTEARALRQAGGPGARAKSAGILAGLARQPGLTDQQRQGLRTEAIAQLALVDVDVPADFPARQINDNPVWDDRFGRYAISLGTNDVEIFGASSEARPVTLPVPRGFEREVVVFSPDGRFLAGVFKRNSSRVLAWRLEDRALVLSNATTSADGYEKPFFSPDSRTLAVYTARGLELHALDVDAAPRVFPRPVSATFSPDSRNLAAVLRTNVEVWPLAAGGADARIHLDFDPFKAAWHPDGRRLAVGGRQGQMVLWEPAPDSGAAGPARRFDGHAGTVVALEFSADGSRLLSTSWDGFSAVWDVPTGRRLLKENRVAFKQIAADSRRLIVETGHLGRRGVVSLLDQTGYRSVLRAERLGKSAITAAFSRDGRLAATDHVDLTRLWDAATGRELARLPGTSPIFLPDGTGLLTCTARGVFRFALDESVMGGGVSNLLQGVEILHRDRAAHPEDAFNSLSLAPDDRTLVVSATLAGVALFDLAGERPLRRVTNVIAHFAGLTADGGWLLTQFHNHQAWLVSLTNEARPRLLGWHLNTAFSPDGKSFALSTHDTLLLHARNATNRWLRTARAPLNLGVDVHTPLAFSPDNRSLAVSTNRFDVHLLDVRDARPLATFSAPPGASVLGRGLTFSADGRFLRALLQDGEVIEWDLPVVRAELAKVGLDWDEQAATPTVPISTVETEPAHGLRRHDSALDTRPRIPGPSELSTVQPKRSRASAVQKFTGDSSLPAVLAGAAGLLALAAGVFVFAHQRRLLAGYAQAERLAAERQQQLCHAQQALFQGQKMEALGTLAAGVAHDFNNLLSIIRMSKQLVDRAVKPEGVTKENLDAIEQAVHQGKSLVNSMLGYSRRPTEAIEDFSVVKVVGDTVALLSRQFLGGLTLNLQLDQSCPPVHGSGARLEQALLNLIVNASEAMKGSGALTIQARPMDSSAPAANGVLQLKDASAGVELSVIDTGPGIAPEALPRIFEPFFTTKTIGTQRGTGLGLSLVYAIARQDGWGLGVQTASGGGTTFTLLLPAGQTALSGRRLPTSQGAAGSGTITTHEQKRIA